MTSRTRITCLVALIVLLGLTAFPLTASAGKVVRTNGMSLVREQGGVPGNFGCYYEDSSHSRTWGGTLNPGQSFDVQLPFCTRDVLPSGPGGTGFLFALEGRGQFDLVATSASGAVYRAHVLSTGPARCLVPPDYMAGTIEPGRWTVTLTNTSDRAARDVYLQVNVHMTWQWWQEGYCPSVDWNFD